SSQKRGTTMHAPNLPDLRRSSRLPLALPILVTSLQPESDFSEVCETLVVNAHGCAIRSSMKLEPGAPVQFQSKEGRWTMAHIVDCQPMDSQFDISLTHMPPEVEEKLWIRLREDLGAQVLQQTRQQSEQVFAAAKEEIGKKIREAQNQFREHLGQELQMVEQRAQGLS